MAYKTVFDAHIQFLLKEPGFEENHTPWLAVKNSLGGYDLVFVGSNGKKKT
jgi:hypothetical protein